MCPIYDIKCEKCDEIREDEWLKIDENPEPCKKCGGKMKKLCGGRFKLLYDNKKDTCGWSNDGYQSTLRNKSDLVDWNAGPQGLPNRG